MLLGNYSQRGLAWAVRLANAHVERDPDLFEIARELFRDKDRPGHQPPVAVTRTDAQRLQATAGELRAVFEAATVNDAVPILNRTLRASHAQPVITRHDDEGWHLHFAEENSPASDLIAATAATALAVVVCDTDLDRIGICDSNGCDQAFVDLSKNNRKRYCSTTCATRESVAAHRKRTKA